MKTRLLTGLILTLLALTLSACAKTEPPAPTAESPIVTPTVNTAYQKFSAELFTKAATPDKKNPVISPASAYLVLAMTGNGAADNTADAFKTVLGTDTAAVNTFSTQLMKNLQDTSGDTTFNLANSIWLNTGYTPKESFIKTTKDVYGADVFEEKLSTAKDTINTWVSEKTNAMIPDFLDQQPADDMRMLLINTLYMKATWANIFNPEATADGVFALEDDTKITIPFMNSDTMTVPFINTGDAEGVVLPYNDGKLAFVAFRAANDRSLADFIADFKPDTLSYYINSAEEKPVKLSMPKFTTAYSFDMKEPLIDMGLGEAFDAGLANFSNMTEANDLYIGEAKQKTKVDVNEAGTEAAASSSVGMSMKSMPMQEDPTLLTLDTPYLYAIVNLEDQTPLFMGVMNAPEK